MTKKFERINSRSYVICDSPDKNKSFSLKKSESLPYRKQKPSQKKSTHFLTAVEERDSRGSSGSLGK